MVYLKIDLHLKVPVSCTTGPPRFQVIQSAAMRTNDIFLKSYEIYRRRKSGNSERVFHPKILAIYKRRVQVRTAPHASIGLVGREMVQRCSGDALQMFRRGSEVTCDRLRRSSNWNLSGAIGSLLGVQSHLFESLKCNAMSILST